MPNVPGAAQVAAGMAPPNPADVPQVEHLLKLNNLWVKQRVDLLELFVNYDVSNQYDVYLSKESKEANSRWLYAKEESDCCQRICVPKCREFTMDVGIASNSPGQAQTFEQQLGLVESKFVIPMIRIHRPCFLICQQYTVQDGRGNNIGGGKDVCTNYIPCCPIKQNVWGPGRSIESDDPQYQLVGPTGCWVECISKCPCRSDLEFVLKDKNERRVGMVANVPNGCLKMCFTNADDYRVDFDPSATAAERGMLLAITFLLDFRFFEAKQEKKNQQHRMF